MADFKHQAPPLNALTDWKLRLTADPVNGGSKRPSLSFGTYKNNPRIIVRTGVDGDKDYGKIVAAMDAPTFFVFLELLKNTIASEGKCRYFIENHNYTFFGGKRSDKPQLVSTTMVGKDDDGRVYLAVTASERPKVRFFFDAPFMHNLVKSDGSKYSQAESSVMYAKSFLNYLTQLVPTFIYNEYQDESKNRQNNNGGGGGNNYSQKPQSNSSTASNFDDDIPF